MKHDRPDARTAPSAQPATAERRHKYQRPEILDLGELSRGIGAACHTGTAVDCAQGGNAVGVCGSGSNNVGPCNAGNRPS